MKVLLIGNPLSHGGRSRRSFEKIFKQMDRFGIDFELCQWDGRDSVIDRIANAKGFDSVVAAGGDGTINTIVNGIMRNAQEKLPLGVIYCGTSPDFCKFHGLPINEIEKSVEVLAQGSPQAVDVMAVKRNEGDPLEFFCCCLNLGMGAAVAAKANRIRPWVGDGIGTFIALISELVKSRKYTYEINGQTVENVNHLLVSKMPFIASGMKINADLKPSDGQFALCVLQNLRFCDWLKLIPKIYRGESVGSLEIRSESIHISSPKTVPVEYDGDPQGVLPVEISIFHEKLYLIKN